MHRITDIKEISICLANPEYLQFRSHTRNVYGSARDRFPFSKPTLFIDARSACRAAVFAVLKLLF